MRSAHFLVYLISLFLNGYIESNFNIVVTLPAYKPIGIGIEVGFKKDGDPPTIPGPTPIKGKYGVSWELGLSVEYPVLTYKLLFFCLTLLRYEFAGTLNMELTGGFAIDFGKDRELSIGITGNLELSYLYAF